MEKEVSTPVYAHIKKFQNVYEPAEDTFLFVDALQSEQSFLRNLQPHCVVEVGCGSGLVSAFLFKILGHSTSYICTDKNPEAALCSAETLKKNQVDGEVVVTDLVAGLLPRIRHRVDVMLFNPPYVVTPSVEIQQNGISSSWAGGTDGREVMDRLFPLVPLVLTKKGVFYLVVIKENKPDEIANLFSNWGFRSIVVMSRRSGPEFLSVMKFWREKG